MTNDEKAKAYDEAIERAKYTLKTDLHESGVWAVKHIFPELRESEDERIRKWIAHYIHAGVFSEDEHPMALKAIEWLEKQKEQKPEGVYVDCTEHPEWYGMPPTKWLVDEDYDEKIDGKDFSLHSVGLAYRGYYIPYSDLLKLPKEDWK